MAQLHMDVAKFSPNGELVAAASRLTSAVYLYSADLKLLASCTFHTKQINALAWSPCGQYIASAGEDCSVVVWRVLGHTLMPKRVLRGHIAPVISLCFHPRGTILASGGVDECVYLWDVINKIPFKRLFVHNEPVFAVDFSFDGDLLLTASFEGFVRIWSVGEGMVLRTLHHAPRMCKISAARFSPNAAFVLICYMDGYIQLVDVVAGRVLRKFSCPDAGAGVEPRHLVFVRPNHFLLATNGGVLKYGLCENCNDEGVLVSTVGALTIDYNQKRGVALQSGPEMHLIYL